MTGETFGGVVLVGDSGDTVAGPRLGGVVPKHAARVTSQLVEKQDIQFIRHT